MTAGMMVGGGHREHRRIGFTLGLEVGERVRVALSNENGGSLPSWLRVAVIEGRCARAEVAK